LWRSRKLFLEPANRGDQCFLGQVAGELAIEFGPPVGREARDALLPRKPRGSSALPGRPPGIANVGGHLERRRCPTESLSRALDLLQPERRTVTILGPRFGRGAESDGGAAGDEGRAVGRLRPRDGRGDRFGVLPVDPDGVPAARLEALDLIDR